MELKAQVNLLSWEAHGDKITSQVPVYENLEQPIPQVQWRLNSLDTVKPVGKKRRIISSTASYLHCYVQTDGRLCEHPLLMCSKCSLSYCRSWKIGDAHPQQRKGERGRDMNESPILTQIWVACDVLACKHDRAGRVGESVICLP